MMSDTDDTSSPPKKGDKNGHGGMKFRKTTKRGNAKKRSVKSESSVESINVKGDSLAKSIGEKLVETMNLLDYYRKTKYNPIRVNFAGYEVNFSDENIIIRKINEAPQTGSLYTPSQLMDFDYSETSGDESTTAKKKKPDHSKKVHYKNHDSLDKEFLENLKDDKELLIDRLEPFVDPVCDISRTRIAISILEEYVESSISKKESLLNEDHTRINWNEEWIAAVNTCYKTQRALGCFYNGRLLYPWLHLLRQAATRTLQNFVCCDDRFKDFHLILREIIRMSAFLENHLIYEKRHNKEIYNGIKSFRGIKGDYLEDELDEFRFSGSDSETN